MSVKKDFIDSGCASWACHLCKHYIEGMNLAAMQAFCHGETLYFEEKANFKKQNYER